MAQYIDKSALVAYINNWIEDARHRFTMSRVQFSLSDRIESLENLLSFLDTLEMKEVDLKEEINLYIESTLTGTNPIYTKRTVSCIIEKAAKHFFELGLSVSNKVQKGENV